MTVATVIATRGVDMTKTMSKDDRIKQLEAHLEEWEKIRSDFNLNKQLEGERVEKEKFKGGLTAAKETISRLEADLAQSYSDQRTTLKRSILNSVLAFVTGATLTGVAFLVAHHFTK